MRPDPYRPEARQVDGLATDAPKWLPDDPPAPAPEARAAAPLRNLAACPVQGCGTTLREEAAGPAIGCAARELVIEPSRAYQPYVCPCPRRALLTVGRTERKGWTLRAHKPTRDERDEINLLAYALVTGHGRRDHARRRPVNTAPHLTSAEMDQAFRASHSLALQVVAQVLAGHPQRARELAEQANAADYAHSLHRRAYRREHRLDLREGRWQNAEEFWIDVHTPDPKHPGQPGFSLRLVLHFLALWNEQEARWDVDGAEEIERRAGLQVGEDSWRALMALLVYLRSETVNEERPNKRGPKVDIYHLIYRVHGASLLLRDPVRDRYPRAVQALEALRRTLSPLPPPPQQLPLVFETEPDWVADLLDEVPANPVSRRQRRRPL
ncbi:hypothetical protein [Deinococcus sp. Leaf326]|uniref:hypothetical protein n=1 Tax=Deinococcus sp. Leaf326 TaxID=1736338 RepID=UPI000701F493|nr:hypothetical protein [Deinococcus sp. Leaf326]KQR37748.1 hypothetical protein ASF71_14805 [Deinococcus sp. Leaf326]